VIYGFREPKMEVRMKLRDLVIFEGYDIKDFLNESPNGRVASVDREKLARVYEEHYDRILGKDKSSIDLFTMAKGSAFGDEIADLREKVALFEQKEIAFEKEMAAMREEISRLKNSSVIDVDASKSESTAQKLAVNEKEGPPYMD
jgi:hypothetical protein